MMIRFLVMTLLCVTISACDSTASKPSQALPKVGDTFEGGKVTRVTRIDKAGDDHVARYQLSIGPPGQIYRIDTATGDVVSIPPPAAISDGRIKLVVGSFYETEQGEVLRYTGAGKFAPRPPLSEIFKK